jgi:hypothetical protein
MTCFRQPFSNTFQQVKSGSWKVATLPDHQISSWVSIYMFLGSLVTNICFKHLNSSSKLVIQNNDVNFRTFIMKYSCQIDFFHLISNSQRAKLEG